MATHYQAFVGPAKRYYQTGAKRFALLLEHGLREHHRVLDVGCGSLRVGRLLIPFLTPGGYCGVEPGERWVREGLEREVIDVWGEGLVAHKQPAFDRGERFEFGCFDRRFDFVLAFSIFIHCGREQLELCLSNLREVIHPETRVLLDVNLGRTGYERGRHRKYPWASARAVRHAEPDLLAVLGEGGYSHEVLERGPDRGAKGSRTLFLLRPVDSRPPADS